MVHPYIWYMGSQSQAHRDHLMMKYMHFVAIFLNKKLVPIRLKPNRIIILAKEVDPVLVVFK